jgi:hypothetical protein
MRTYGKLREKIRNVFVTIGAFADALNRDRSTVSKKLNGIVPWDQVEIEASCQLLGISRDDIPEYFFYEV